jgi:hypothetical protein
VRHSSCNTTLHSQGLPGFQKPTDVIGLLNLAPRHSTTQLDAEQPRIQGPCTHTQGAPSACFAFTHTHFRTGRTPSLHFFE